MIVLASTSSTRQGLLRNAGLAFSAESPQVDEAALVLANPQWQPQEVAMSLAEAKAVEVSRRYPDAVVIGADQVLALGGRIFGKPRDRAHCRDQLLTLRNARHSLISAVVLAQGGKRIWAHADEAVLTMRDFSPAFLENYLDLIGEDCTTSVGGYKVEGLGVQLFTSIEGNHFTILGLPLIPLLERLRSLGEVVA